MRINSALIGRHNLYNILAAIGAALALNIPPHEIGKGIAALKAVPGRLERVPTRSASRSSSTTPTRTRPWEAC